MAVSATRLPSKLFFRIGEVASLVGVEPHVLRYWEREFRSIRPTKSAKGQRVYSRKDVENLLRVRDLLYRDGFTIAGAKKRLQRGGEDLAVALAGAGENESESAPAHDHDHADDHDHAHADEHAHDHHLTHLTREDGVEAVGLREPVSGPRSHGRTSGDGKASGVAVKVKLTALRAEVEAFLDDLGDSGDDTGGAA